MTPTPTSALAAASAALRLAGLRGLVVILRVVER